MKIPIPSYPSPSSEDDRQHAGKNLSRRFSHRQELPRVLATVTAETQMESEGQALSPSLPVRNLTNFGFGAGCSADVPSPP